MEGQTQLQKLVPKSWRHTYSQLHLRTVLAFALSKQQGHTATCVSTRVCARVCVHVGGCERVSMRMSV
jgi:hypothetical protein